MFFKILFVFWATCFLVVLATPIENFFEKIVGGAEAYPHSHPYIVAIWNSDQERHWCGGSIINERTILTAAHCEITTGSYYVIAGEHNNQETEGTEQTRYISQVINHENYNAENKDNDIAILKLSQPLNLNENVKRITLAPNNFSPRGNALVAGWGNLFYKGDSPSELYEVTIPIVSNNECNRRYRNAITNNMMCAGTEGKDSCQGDSGGPLMCNNNNAMVQCGVVSFGSDCGITKILTKIYPLFCSKIVKFLSKLGHKDYPGVYARVSRYLQWIRRYS